MRAWGRFWLKRLAAFLKPMTVKPRRLFVPLEDAAQRRRAGGFRPALFESPQGPSLASHRARRVAQGTPAEGVAPGVAFSLATFFWRSKRTYPRPQGANQGSSQYLCLLTAALLTLLVAACGSAPRYTPPPEPAEAAGKPPATKAPTRKPAVVLKKGGGFYKDDGPAEEIPDGLDDIPDAEPKWEPVHKPATKPYVVLGKEYVPNPTVRPYKARGIASWYGKKFHGQKTSIGEPYDMFAMTAAHTTLAIPSYVRVSNVQSGKAVVLRVTDRGPFHVDRIIDLSYTAAYKLGLVNGGSGLVEVEAIIPGETTAVAAARATATAPAERDEIEELTRRLGREEQASQSAAMAGQGGEATIPKGVYLQLGAFGNADNAESLKNHLARELDWVAEPMRIVVGNNIHRLQVGPYPSRGEADRVAEKIRLALGYKPTFVTRP